MRWKFNLLFYFILLFSPSSSNDKEQEDARLVSDDIDSYYSDLMSISGATIDAIGATRQWKPKTTTLIKEGTGVAFLFGKGVRRRLPYPKGSKQYNESSSIYVYEKKLDRLSKDLDRNWKFNINNMLIDQQWKLQVEAPLKNLRMKSNLLTNPDSTKDDVVVNSFRIICKRDSKSDPLTTLDCINKMASITGILAHDISLLPEAEATKHLNRIQEDIYHKNFYKYDSALDFLEQFADSLPMTDDPCVPRKIIEGSRFEREPVQRAVDLIRSETALLSDAVLKCSEIVYPNDTLERDTYRHDGQIFIDQIMDSLDTFVPDMLSTFWPENTIEVMNWELAQRACEIAFRSVNRWNKTAHDIKKSLNARGNDSLIYQLAMVEPFYSPSDWFFLADGCKSVGLELGMDYGARCFYSIDQSKPAHYVVSSFKKVHRPSKAWTAYSTWNKNLQTINETVTKLYNVNSLNTLVSAIRDATSFDFSHYFSSSFLVRKYGDWMDGPQHFGFGYSGTVERSYGMEVQFLQNFAYWYNASGTFNDPEHFEMFYFFH
uniref:Uncharacterized protein n=1 Tax=Ditylenchus dipsaci TaxID=166011 RepID=A0A915DAP4_9BILA